MSPSPEALANEYRQWIISPNGPAGEVLPKSSFNGPADRNYSLKGTDPSSPETFIQNEDSMGINLGWTDRGDAATEKKVRRWFFTKEGSGPIRYGELIALANGGQPSFLYYKKRTVGPNLEWSKTPKYQWQIWGGKKGEPVRTGDRVMLYNTESKFGDAKGEPLIYFSRPAGANLGWPSSESWSDKARREIKEAAFKAAMEYAKAQSGQGAG